jgi:hypothetical protein
MGAVSRNETKHRVAYVPGTTVPRRPGTIQTVRADGTVETKWLDATGEPGDSLGMRPDSSLNYMRCPPRYKRGPV